MILINGKDMYCEYGCIAQFYKNENKLCFTKPSVV